MKHDAQASPYFGRNGLAADGPLLVKRLSDENPVVRELAGQAVWLAWGRSGDAETDRLLEYDKAIEHFRRALAVNPNLTELESLIRGLEALLREQRQRSI